MDRYEYKVTSIPMRGALTTAQFQKGLKELEADMNKLGLEGWELVQKVEALYYFKRKLKD